MVKKKYSLNPNNGKKYTLPKNTNDRENIDIAWYFLDYILAYIMDG